MELESNFRARDELGVGTDPDGGVWVYFEKSRVRICSECGAPCENGGWTALSGEYEGQDFCGEHVTLV